LLTNVPSDNPFFSPFVVDNFPSISSVPSLSAVDCIGDDLELSWALSVREQFLELNTLMHIADFSSNGLPYPLLATRCFGQYFRPNSLSMNTLSMAPTVQGVSRKRHYSQMSASVPVSTNDNVSSIVVSESDFLPEFARAAVVTYSGLPIDHAESTDDVRNLLRRLNEVCFPRYVGKLSLGHLCSSVTLDPEPTLVTMRSQTSLFTCGDNAIQTGSGRGGDVIRTLSLPASLVIIGFVDQTAVLPVPIVSKFALHPVGSKVGSASFATCQQLGSAMLLKDKVALLSLSGGITEGAAGSVGNTFLLPFLLM
jgi:hypothetical protein